MALPVTITGISTAVAPVGPFKIAAGTYSGAAAINLLSGTFSATVDVYGPGSTREAVAQNFTNPSGSSLTIGSCAFRLYGQFSPTDNVYAQVCQTDHAGTVLATSDLVPINPLWDYTSSNVVFTFPTPAVIAGSATFAIVLRRTATSTSNLFGAVARTEAYTGGASKTLNGTTGVWSADGNDLICAVYSSNNVVASDAYYFFGRDGTTATTLRAYKAGSPDKTATIYTIATNLVQATAFGAVASSAARWQTFTTGAETTAIAAVTFALDRVGSPTDSPQVDIYAADPTLFTPVGPSLGSATLPVGTVTGVSTRHQFNFTTPVPVSPNTRYVAAVSRTGPINASLYFRIYSDGTTLDLDANQYSGTFNSSTVSWGVASTTDRDIIVYQDGWLPGATKTGFTTAILSFSAYQVGPVIHIAVMDGTLASSIAHKYVSFDMATDTFLATTETIMAAANPAGQVAGAGAGNSIVVRSGGEVVAFFNSLQTNTSGTPRARVSYSRRTAVNTWAAAVRVDANTATDNVSPFAVLGAANRVHFFWNNQTGIGYRTLSAANALNTAGASASISNPGDGVSYDRAGTTKVVVISNGAGGQTVGRFDSSDNPTPTIVNLGIAVATVPHRVGAFPNTDDVTIVYRSSADSDLYSIKSSDDGATFASPVSFFVGTVASADANVSRSSTGSVYTRGTNIVVGYIVNDGGTLKYNENIISALTTGYTLTADKGSVTLAGVATGLRAARKMFVPASSDHWLLTSATNNNLGFTTTTSEMCQSFTAGGSLSSVTLYPSKSGTPPYSVVAKIYAADGSHFPTGAQIGPTSSNSLSSADLTTDPAPFTFVFPTPISLSAATEYALVLELVGTADPAQISFEISTSDLGDVYPGGAVSRKLSGVWTTTLGGTRDMRGTLHFTGPVAVAGLATGLSKGYPLTTATGAVTVTRYDATLLHKHFYTLPITVGTVAVTFNPANLVKFSAKQLVADTGAVTFAGYAAGLRGGRGVLASKGSVTLAGQAAALRHTHVLTAATGAVALSGKASTLRTGHVVTAAKGAVTLAGQAATLRHATVMPAAQGAVTLTGYAADLRKAGALRLTANTGAVTVALQSATLRRTIKMPTTAGAVLLSGQVTTLRYGHIVTAAAGAVTFTGYAADLRKAGALGMTADTGAVTVAGQAATPRHGYVLQAAPSSQTGDFVDDNGVTSFIDDLGVPLWVDDNGLILGGYGGPVAVTGYAAALTYAPGAVTDITLSADPGAIAVAGQAAILRYGHALIAAQGAVTVTFNDANLKLRRFLRMIAAPGGIVLSGVPVGLSTAAHKSLAAVKGDIIVSRKAAELRVSRKLPALSGPILVTGLNVNLDAKFRVHYRLDIACGDIVVTGQQANLLAPYPKEKQPGPLVFGRRLVVIPGRW